MDWYRIREIALADYIDCIAPLYEVLEGKTESVSQPDVFLKAALAGFSGMTSEQWEAAERQRLYEKRLSMKMGDFHEELMGKFPGRVNLPVGHETGTDVGTVDNTEFMEIKNRDNTMNSGSAESVVRKLTQIAERGQSAILVLVNCVKKTVPRFGAPKSVRVMNGKEAYAYLSGRETFYDDLQLTLNETFRRFKTLSELRVAIA